MNGTIRTQSTERFVQKPGNIATDMDGEKVMLNIRSGNYYNLGEIGGEIWDLIETPLSLRQLADVLMERYEVERSVCEQHVKIFLRNLVEAGLIEALSAG